MSVPACLIATLLWRPAFTPTAILFAVAILAALALTAYARSAVSASFGGRAAQSLLFVMRLAAIAGLGAILMGPSLLPPTTTRTQRSTLHVLLDVSASMLTPDCGQRSRVRSAIDTWLDDSTLRDMREQCDVVLSQLGAGIEPLVDGVIARPDEEIATADSTRLAVSLTKVLDSFGRAAGASADAPQVLILSDGRDTDGADLRPVADLARARGVALHTVCFGTETLERDIALRATPLQDHLLVREEGAVLVEIMQVGFDAAAVTLEITGSGVGTGGRETRNVAFEGRRSIEIVVPISQEMPGEYEYGFRVLPERGEAEPRNNEQVVFCEVLDERIRVLLLEGQPFWDTKFIAQALRKDERIALRQVSQLSSERQETIVTRLDGTTEGEVPRTADAWSRYDVVILGRDVERVLSVEAAGQLRSWVLERGGQIVLARGQPCVPKNDQSGAVAAMLEALEPVSFDGSDRSFWPDTALRLTSSGEVAPWLSEPRLGVDLARALETLPGFARQAKVVSVKPASIVLAVGRRQQGIGDGDGDGPPAFVSMSAGRGGVVALLGEGLWKWSLLEREREELRGLFDRFWSSLVRWMALGGDLPPGEQVALRLSRSAARRGETIVVEVIYEQPPGEAAASTASLIGPDGKMEIIPLHLVDGRRERQRGEFTAGVAGVYRVSVVTPHLAPASHERRVSVTELAVEKLDTSADPLGMRMLSERSGGQSLRPGETDRFIDLLDRRRIAAMVSAEPEYIWNRGLVLVLLLTWIGSEWLLRRAAGLL